MSTAGWRCPSLQAYCAEIACFDYHYHVKGSNATLKLKAQLLPLVEEFVKAHGFHISTGKLPERWVLPSTPHTLTPSLSTGCRRAPYGPTV